MPKDRPPPKTRKKPASGPVDPRRIPQQARSRARFEAILRSARRVIGERSDVNMREIADDANVPIASVYQYFPDKTAVLRALTLRFYERIQSRLELLLASVKRIEDVPASIDTMIDGLVIELGEARAHLNIWAVAQGIPILRELDAKDALALADRIEARILQLAPALDRERVRDACVFAIMMAGPAVRLSFLIPEPDRARVLRELKALIRLRTESLLPANPPAAESS